MQLSRDTNGSTDGRHRLQSIVQAGLTAGFELVNGETMKGRL
jgi:hypothetical protein